MSRQVTRLGMRANWQQFTLLVVINAFVGAMVGLERTILPIIAEEEFGLVSHAAVLSFLISFGLVKALANLFAGHMSDRVGRRRILIAGWLAALPVPWLIILAPTWGWIVFANVLLGINQGLCWSTTVIMKIDLAGPERRGLAMGINESAGYVSVSLVALMTSYLASAYALRPVPFYPGIAFSVLGLLLSVFFVRETKPFAELESRTVSPQNEGESLSLIEVLARTGWKNRNLLAANQAGLVNNLNDGVVWGLIPVFLSQAGLPLEQVGIVVAAYPLMWGLGQLGSGALSDVVGRKWLIVTGMWVQASSIVLLVVGQGFGQWLAAALLLGVGTALVYPTLLASVSDAAHPGWRSSAIGVYRLWRDSGFAVGALLGGIVADVFGLGVAVLSVAGLTFLSGVVVASMMRVASATDGV